MKPEEGAGQVFTVSQDWKADGADSLTVRRGEKVTLVKTSGQDPSKWFVSSSDSSKKKGWVPIVVLTPKDEMPASMQEMVFKREAVISELVETEEEFCRDIMQVVDRYVKPLDRNSTPRNVSDSKDKVFGNFKDIALFHNTVLLEGIKYYAKEPKQLGRAFLRMERDFDKHVMYCHNEPSAQDFLEENYAIRDYFDDLSAGLSDDKSIAEHLKLPVQRINDYQLLIKELVKYSEGLKEDSTDLNRALELMLAIPHKAEDIKYISNIEGYHGDVHKLGRLLRHNWFKVTGKDGKEHDRYLFLFKARILICKVRKISDDRFVFNLKDIIRLPDVQVKDHKTDPKEFEVGPFLLKALQDHVKEPWLEEIKQYSRNALTLAEHAADDLRIQEVDNKDLKSLKGVELLLASSLQSSDEEMTDRFSSNRRTSLSKRVEEVKASSMSSESYSMTKTSVMSSSTMMSSSSVVSSSSIVSSSNVIMSGQIEEAPEILEIEDTSSRCNTLTSLFKSTIEGSSCEPGECAAFECCIEAARLVWLKDNRTISDRLQDRIATMTDGSNHRLEILNVAESDAGVYTAHATTPSGDIATCTANLVVHRLTDEERKARAEANAPVFIVMLKDTELLQNTYLRCMVKVKGNPNPTVKFYKDNKEITYKNERIAVMTDKEADGYYEVIIPNVQASDAGAYKCIASNRFGSAESGGKLTVVDDKKIFEPTIKQEDGKEPAFTWIRDGKPFNPEERFKVIFQDDEDSLALVFTHVKPEDAGLYTCVASTTSGKISCSAELTVQGNVNLLSREPEEPKISASHKVVDSNVGSSAMLETKVKGYPKPDVKWYRGSEEVVMGDRFKMLYEDDETISLVVKTVTVADTGEYKVVASNAAGSCEDTVTLSVKAPPTFKKKLNDVSLIAGASLTLQIEVDANPKPTVTWFKDGKEVSTSEHIKMTENNTEYTLKIDNCNLYDVGNYSVICKNEISQCSEFCKVEIEGAPMFTRNLIKKVETEEGDSLTFLVKVHGNPMPIVKWYFKGKPVVSDTRCKISHDGDTHTLTINSINRDDAGDYTCELTNAHGSVSDQGVVMVKCSPKFTKGLGNIVAQEGDTNVGFRVEVEAFPKSSVKWFINSTEITSSQTEYMLKEEDDSFTLVLKDVKRESAGKYTCKIQNAYGSNETSAELTVLCKPVFKQELKNVTVNAGDTLTLQIEIQGTPEPDVKWFKDGQEVTSDTHIKIKRDTQKIENYSLTVDLVKYEDSGEYEVRATNEMGSAVSKSTVIVQTKDSSGLSEKTTSSSVTSEDATGTTVYEEKIKKIESPSNTDMENIQNTKHKLTLNLDTNQSAEEESSNGISSRSEKSVIEIINNETEKNVIEVDDIEEEPEEVTVHIQEKARKTLVSTPEPIISEPCSPRTPDVQKGLIGERHTLEIEEVDENSSKVENSITSSCQYTAEFDSNDGYYEERRSIITKTQMEAIYEESPSGSKICETEIVTIISSQGTAGEINKMDTMVVTAAESAIEIDIEDASKAKKLKGPSFEEAILESPEKAVSITKEEADKGSSQSGIIQDTESTGNRIASEEDEDDDEVEKLLSKAREQRENLSKIIQRQESSEVVIQAIPKITDSQMKNTEVFETWETTFQLSATGVPRPEQKWYKDGTEISSSNKFKITSTEISANETTYKLDVVDCQQDNAGEYKVVLSNVLGEDSDSAVLSVKSAQNFRLPQINTPLVDMKVEKNVIVKMVVVLTADPIPDVQWKHDQKEMDADFIQEAESKKIHHGLKECTYTLTIPKSKHADTGKYIFIAGNKSGKVESSARLDVVLKPEIEVFKDISGIPYEDVQFVAVIYSNPRATITWRKDGKKIAEESSAKYEIVHDQENEIYKLKVKNLLTEDGGVYTVSAVNDMGEASADAKLKVHTEEPTFTKPLEDISIRDYAPLELKIRAEGVPKPDITWSKDGIDLEESEGMQLYTRCEGQVSSQLSIPHFSEEYVGKYKARAYNLAGHCDSHCLVKMVQMAPIFSKALDRAVNVEEKDPLELNCKIEASPRANFKWFKDGEELKPSDHVVCTFKPDGTVKLRIDSVTPNDCGAYKLVAENINGVENAICAVSVTPNNKKPEFLSKPEDVSITEGQPLLLEAKVMAFPLPEIKWFKDGHPVRNTKAINFVNSPGGIVGLSIDQSALENAGTYELTVSNKLGDASATAKVEVLPKDKKPEFHGHLLPTTVVEGFPTKLCVKLVGTPAPQLSWTLNGNPIDIDGQHFKVVDLPDGVQALMIDNCSAIDAGVYGVTATNAAGTVTSEAKLDVTGQARDDMPEEKPSFAYDLRDAFAEEGGQLIFSIPYRGNPVPEVKWSKDGEAIKPDHRITLTNDGHKLTLQINPCEMNDAGRYSCKLNNSLGSEEKSAQGNIKKVYHAPLFTQKLIDTEQVIGLDGKMVCKVSGNPRPNISWYLNDKKIQESGKYGMKRDGDSCILYIKECAPDDDGMYKCVASNRDGEDSTQSLFRAVDKITSKEKGEPPCFLKKIGDQEVVNGITGRFTACISGFPTPEVEWYRNGSRLFPSDRIKMDHETNGLLRLTISHIDPAVDIGQYKLRISNNLGEDECEASLIYDIMGTSQRKPVGEQYKDFEEFKMTGSPLPLPDKPIISRMSDRRLTLSWKPSIPIGPREPVTYLVEMCEQPNGNWFNARSGLRSCSCEIRNLEPFRDYKFRVRVENKFGVSDPSPHAITFRAKLLPDQPKFIPYLAPGIDFRPDSSPYFPKDFDIERPPHDGYAQAPRFLRQEHFTQYGVKGHNCNLFWFVYGYPKPKMTYFFNDEPIEMGGRYDCSYTRNGQATLFINKMLERDVGVYEAVATNEHGEARQRVHLEIAEYPEFIRRPEEITILARNGGKLEARVVGVPYPEIKWFKDWQPLAVSSRIKFGRYDPDHCVLTLNDAITKDAGLYSITASNVAGAVSCSVMVHIEDKEEFPFHSYGLGHNIKLKTKNLSDFYDLGDELGRGTQGITYHAVERATGRNYAAKLMRGKHELKTFMHNELDIMNQLRSHKIVKIHDGFETLDSIVLIMELGSGGELLDCLTKAPYTNEHEIASYIRQLLVALDYLHDQSIAHVGLTPGDMLISHSGGDSLKLCDFGLARRIHPGQLKPEEYGMPEFVSPEIIRGEGISCATDMWSVGVITYLLLTGESLFRGANDRETLTRVKDGFWEFSDSLWKHLSLDARDFVTKLIVVDVEKRIDVKEALRHPWLKLADRTPQDMYSISTENLHNYYNAWKDWYRNASCRTWYRRRPLVGAFTHPSKMVYPPNYIATPTETPERDLKGRDPRPRMNLGDSIRSRQPLDYEVGAVSSESHYQNGPDTYLLQLRDVEFPVRLREYMKVAAHRHHIPKVTDESHLDWELPVIRERRRFTDVMDEEIDDERKQRINQYNLGDSYTVRRLKHELGTRLDTHVEAEAIIEASRQGQAPFLREKPRMTAILGGQPAELVCYAVGNPKPSIQWFKNDMMIGNSNRIKIEEDDKGRSILRFQPSNNTDVGIYKVVARNRVGQTTARARLVLAGVPDAPDSPEVTDISDTEILLRWKQPKHDGHSPVICYMLQSKAIEGGEWTTVSETIDHEFFLVRKLKPVTGYIFRLAAKNRIGWSDSGVPTSVTRTNEEGCPKVEMSRSMKHLQAMSESGQGVIDDTKHELDYSLEDNPSDWLPHQPTEKFSFISEIYRGRFSVVVKAIDKTTDNVVVAKLLEYSQSTQERVNSEFEVLRALRHDCIASLLEAYKPPDATYAAFILEKLQGADVLTYLSNKHEYSEQVVATITSQILDGLQYLHWRGICHLDLQPDNIVMASLRSVNVKLVDMGCAQRVSKLGNVVKSHGALEFSAPEVICQEPAYPQSDVWSVGVLAYLMLSGVSPFHSETVGETRQNINFVRYRFEYLYKEITQEATRFLMLVFKRAPNKRPTAEECHENRWLMPNDYMIKKRERAVFLGNRLKAFSDNYHQQREQEASTLEALTCLVSNKGPLLRSNSIQEEIISTS